MPFTPKKLKKKPCFRCGRKTRLRFKYSDGRQAKPRDAWKVPVCDRCAPSLVTEFANNYLPQPVA